MPCHIAKEERLNIRNLNCMKLAIFGAGIRSLRFVPPCSAHSCTFGLSRAYQAFERSDQRDQKRTASKKNTFLFHCVSWKPRHLI